MKTYSVEQGKLDLHSNSGIHLAGLILRKVEPLKYLKESVKRRKGSILDSDILKTVIGLHSMGRSDFNDVCLFNAQIQDNEDELFANAFDLTGIPSESNLRYRLEELPRTTREQIRRLNEELLKQRTLTGMKLGKQALIPVDMDVSPFDNSGSKKQGVSFTYKKHDGYSPMLAYIGKEGYLLDCELREGKQHCQKGTPEFIQENLKRIHRLGLADKVVFRLDSGNDAAENIELLKDSKAIIKRNLRQENLRQWFDHAQTLGTQLPSREGKEKYVAMVYQLHPGNDKTLESQPVVVEATRRTIGSDGNLLLIPEFEVNTYWAINLGEQCPEAIIEAYHDHGTSEQYHSELKGELDLERLPSGRFDVNYLILLCGMIAFNLLRTIGSEVIKHSEKAPYLIKVGRLRIKSVLQNIIYSACRIVRSGNRTRLVYGKRCPWFDVIESIFLAYA